MKVEMKAQAGMPCTVWPRVATAGETAEVCVRGRGDVSLHPEREYSVRFFSKVDRTDDRTGPARTDAHGVLRAGLSFRARGEYTLDVREPGEDNTEKNKQPPLLSAQLFAASREMAGLRPFKGDVHMHTTGSDGKHSVREMLPAARSRGMDVVAITDHDNHAPSVEGEREAAAWGGELVALRGEEITIRERGGHVLALNTPAPIGTRCHADATMAAYAGLAAAMGDRALIPPLTPGAYACARWVVDEIHAAGGLALMAHPYWEGSRGKFYPPRCVFEQLLADGLLDGVELVGGSPATEGNLLCVAQYAERMARGERWAIVGGGDAHAADEIGREFTIVFAEALSADAVVRAVRERRSVACDARMGPASAVFGPFDLVEYAYFLLREFFPEHDRLCAAQASEWAKGHDGAGIAGELATLRTRFWEGMADE